MTTNHLDFSKKNYDAYVEELNRECASNTPLSKASYTYETEKKIQSVAEQIFSSLYSLGFLPYQLIHWLTGLTLNCTTCTSLSKLKKQRTALDNPSESEPWRYKRISIKVEERLIDAMLIVRGSTAENGRWILNSNTSGDFYEAHKKSYTALKKLGASLNMNMLVFNDPGVGASQGSFTKEKVIKTQRAMFRFLEDKEKGIGANTIIGRSFCLGGNIQGEALKDHKLQPDIKYVFVKKQSVYDLSKVVSSGFWGSQILLTLCGWNMDTLSSSKQLNAHEILLHTANVNTAMVVSDPELLTDDGLLAKEDTLGYRLLKYADGEKLKRTTVIGLTEDHSAGFKSDTFDVLIDTIKGVLREPLTD